MPSNENAVKSIKSVLFFIGMIGTVIRTMVNTNTLNLLFIQFVLSVFICIEYFNACSIDKLSVYRIKYVLQTSVFVFL